MNKSSLSSRLLATDALLLVGLLIGASTPLAAAYSGPRWLIAVAGGAIVAVAVVELARRLRWGPLLSALTLIVGALAFGPALAAPDDAVAGLVPTAAAEHTLLTGVVESWRTVLTLPVPLGTSRGELVVPFLVALLGGALGAVFLWRTSRSGLVIVPILAVFAVSAAFGVRDADVPLWRGILLAAGVLMWMRWRAMRSLRAAWRRRVALGTALVAVAAMAAAGTGAAFGAFSDRDVIRDNVEPPLRKLELKSPLAAYRSFYKNGRKTDVLFTIEGLPVGASRLRLATMDDFDGVVWNVTTTDRATGTSAFKPAPASRAGNALQITVGEYVGPWLPTVGEGVAATQEYDADPGSERELLINAGTGSLLEYGNARKGDVYDVDWEARPRREDLPPDAIPDPTVILPGLDFGRIEPVDDLVQKWLAAAGASTAQERLDALEAELQRGYFSDGQDPVRTGYSDAGHGVARLLGLVADPGRMVGNEEQYASAMAYAAQRLGIPARVVLGFEEVTSGRITGEDISAWVEVPFQDFGWVVYDPTPPDDRTPPPLSDAENPAPQPIVVQPPVLPDEPDEVQGVPPEGAPGQLGTEFWEVLLRILGYVWAGVKVLALLSPVWLILMAKYLRRRRRRRASDPVVALSGAWREVSDLARDLGAKIPKGHTRHEVGQILAVKLGDQSPTTLAAIADMHVFGPGVPDAAEVDAYWVEVGSALREIRKASPWWRRVAAPLSPVSLPWSDYGSWLIRSSRRLVERFRLDDAVRAVGTWLTGLGRRRAGSAA